MWIFDWDHGGFRNREEGRFVRVRDLVEAANAGRWEPPPKKEWKHQKVGVTMRISGEEIKRMGGVDKILRAFPGLEVVEEE